MKNFYSLVKGVILIVLSFLFVVSVFIYLQLSYKNPREVTILFDKGTSVRKISSTLEKKEVIRNKFFFEFYLRFSKKQKDVRSGEYKFAAGITLQEIIHKLITGDVIKYQFTIPEGFNLKQIRDLLVNKKKIISAEDFDFYSRDISFLREKEREKASSLEGFLFPDTYTYEKTTTTKDLFSFMVKNFYNQIDSQRGKIISDSSLSLYEVITLASIVEKETGKASERPLIASVFFNRLRDKMPLQSDPTVIYGLENFDGNLKREHLITDTPYNTYTRPGLPKGPICSVGTAAIDAILNPADSHYFFFVGKGDGSHFFSKTLEKHNQAVRYFQLKQGSEPQPE